MGITKFIYALLICAVVFLVTTKEQVEIKVKKEEKPSVTFENSVMYEIDSKSVKQVIQSQKADIYKKHEELYNATIIAKSDANETTSNSLSANHMVKIKDQLFVNGDVHFQSEDDIILKSQELRYNMKTKILQNDTQFEAINNNNIFKGEKLYFDGDKKQIIAKKTQFKIDLGDNNETK